MGWRPEEGEPGRNILGSLPKGREGVEKVAWELWGGQWRVFLQECLQVCLCGLSHFLFAGEKHDWDGAVVWDQVSG